MKKRSLKIGGHATSVSLEEEFWTALRALAAAENIALNQLITRIDENRRGNNLSSALRVYVLTQLTLSSRPERSGVEGPSPAAIWEDPSTPLRSGRDDRDK